MINKQTIFTLAGIATISGLLFFATQKSDEDSLSEYELLVVADHQKLSSGVYSINQKTSPFETKYNSSAQDLSVRNAFAPAINAVAIAKFLNGNLPSTTPSGNNGIPNLLSQTGAFSNTGALSPAPGLIPYDMIEPFWSDGATKKRWMAIPNNGSYNTPEEQITFSNDNAWDFPKGAVLIKHFEIAGQRLETRFEVKGDDDVYYYLTYKWNSAQTDATLLNTSLDEDIVVNGVTQSWHYPSRTECASCHFPQNGSVLGPKTRNLNKAITYPSTGVTMNQLVNLSELGIITQNISNANVGNYDAVAAKDDLSRSLEDRARTYLDVNCASCHNPSVDNVALFDARYETPLENQNIINGAVIYDEGLNNPRVIIPQDVDNSMAHFRMNSTQTGIEMPPLAKDVVDVEGVQLIADWINSLSPNTSTAPVAEFSASTTNGTAPLSVDFDASASYDFDGDALTYTWNFGDGSTSQGQTTNHVYTNFGSFTASLTVNDGQFSNTKTTTIIVNTNDPGGNTVSFTDGTFLIPQDNFSGLPMGVIDMNGDGKDDIVQFNSARNLRIQYQNSPGQTFSSYGVGSVSSNNQWGTAIADFDQNGYNDIMSGGAYDNLKIITNNNGNNSYSVSTLSNSNIFLQGANFADINNDGWADIFACHDDAESRAYQNNQDGTLSYNANLIRTFTTPSSDNSGNYASMWMDYDNDGDLDLYISKCRGGVNSSSDPRRINMLWQNDGNNNYTEVAGQANLKIGDQTWLSDFGDIDNDGDLDAIVINHGTGPNLMRNNGNGTFTEITSGSGLLPTLRPEDFFGIQGFFKDFNNDGFIDLMVSGDNHYIFYNNGDGTFKNAPNPFNSNQIQSFSVGDLNHDGFLDIYAGYANGLNSPSSTKDRIWINQGNSNNFLNIQLKGTDSNINGIGARVEVYGAWGKQIRDVRSGEGYGLVNTYTQHFGLGLNTQVDKVIVRWPSGNVDEVLNPTANQFLVITENQVAPPQPTCNDGIQNGDETGVDCGGSCPNACPCVGEVVFSVDFENGAGNNWTTSGSASTGTFVVADPTAQTTSGVLTQLEDDHSTNGSNALFTATNTSVGVNDVDGGEVMATSPTYNITNQSELSLWYFFGQRDAGDDAGDYFLLEYSLDGGSTYITLASYGDERVVAEWTEVNADIPAGSNLVIRVSAADGPATGDIVEAGIDDLVITEICEEPVSVTGVTVDPQNVNLVEGNSSQLTATVQPIDADNNNVNWASSNTNIATVDQNGSVTAVGEGSATITVTTNDGGFEASSTVTVTAAPIDVTGVSVSPNAVNLVEGEQQQLNESVNPSNADDTSVSWASSNTNIATVDQNGVVTAVSEGSATITVTTNDGGFEASSTVTVTAAPIDVTGVSVSPTTVTLEEEQTQQLTATVSPSDASDAGVNWSSSDANVATVDENGIVTAVNEGSATITVTTDDGGFEASSTVTVTAAPIDVTGVSVSPTTVTLEEEQTQQLTATVSPSDASDAGVNWSSSDANVATVDENGIVTAVNEGSATITVTTDDGGFEASTIVNVVNDSGCTPANVALSGTTDQSSTYGNGDASLAINGQTQASSPWSADLQHTENQYRPWWQVDLGGEHRIESITIHNRTNGFQSRLKDFYILVSDTPFNNQGLDELLTNNGIYSQYFAGEVGIEETFSIQTEGRYVRIQLANQGILHMAEVEVMGCFLQASPCDGVTPPQITAAGPFLDTDGVQQLAATPAGGTWSGASSDGTFDPSVGEGTYSVTYTHDNGQGCVRSDTIEIQVNTSVEGCVLTNVALGNGAEQSSTYGNGRASLAINGQTQASSPWSADLQHTNNEFRPWWQVDLGGPHNIDQVRVFNRTNGFRSRLKDFYILVSDVPFADQDLDQLLANSDVYSQYFSGEAGLEENLSIQTEGRYVRIQLSGQGILHMAEVEIMGCQLGVQGLGLRVAVSETQPISGMELSPVPANDVLNVNYFFNDTAQGPIELSLFDNIGRVMITRTLSSEDFQETLNISHLSVGVYALKLQKGDEVLVKQFTISR
jgi:uncharacterized repeat protein (TIGR03806 family)